MIPSLLFLLVRRYQKRHPQAVRRLASRLRFAARIGLLLLLMTGVAIYAFSQERVLPYIIKRSGTTVGNLIVRENRTGNQISYKLQSVVKSSFVFTVTVKTQEEAIYDNGVLTYLRFYQTLNNSERVNTKIEATTNGYMLVSEKESKPIYKDPITYNQICLYTVEPLHLKKVFADKFKQFIPIEIISPHHYKITFPDGASNEYFYQDGICVKAKLNTTWFTAEMELKR